jgi:hypothetical protein
VEAVSFAAKAALLAHEARNTRCSPGGVWIAPGERETLTKLALRLDTQKIAAPSFKMVLTAVGDFAYRRPDDGVIVCPIGALKP